MKKLFLLIVAMMIAVVSFAQNTLVATLTHDDEIKMYYGANAYKDAYNAAADGDVINLSGGKFYPVDITKAITVRGTGILDANPTIIEGGFNVNIPTTESMHLTMEGIKISNDVHIKGNTTRPCFMKCSFRVVYVQENTQRAMFMSCEMTRLDTSSSSTSQCISCYIGDASANATSTEFINCVIALDARTPSYITNTNLVNCIIVNKQDRQSFYSFPITTTPINCVSIGLANPFSGANGSNNISELEKSIFIDSDIKNDLTDDAKAKYLGYDGTPVGMYGGVMPKNMIPSYPRITKMNVAKQTTADGKLSVEIEVSAAE